MPTPVLPLYSRGTRTAVGLYLHKGILLSLYETRVLGSSPPDDVSARPLLLLRFFYMLFLSIADLARLFFVARLRVLVSR